MDIHTGLAMFTGLTLVGLGSGLLVVLVLDTWQRISGSPIDE